MPQSKGKSETKYKDPIPTTDIILRKSAHSEQILIERRGRFPFENMYALPGGHVDYGETVEEAALRELKEECGVKARLISILGVYSDPKRDPRGQRITTVFIGDYTVGNVEAKDDAKSAKWIDLDELLKLKKGIAFDHYQILSDYRKWFDGSKSGNTFWSTKKS